MFTEPASRLRWGAVIATALLLTSTSACELDESPTDPDGPELAHTTGTALSRSGQPKEAVCHRTGEDERYLKISVGRPAVPAHLGHGDGQIGDPVPGQFGRVFDESCLPVPARVLVDASKDGGGWWFPQSEPFDPSAPHQGRDLADYMRSRGLEVDELHRGAEITEELLARYHLVILPGAFSSFAPSELQAYESYIAREDTRLLIAGTVTPGVGLQAVTGLMGLELEGVPGVRTLIPLGGSPLTEGVSPQPFYYGAAISGAPSGALVPLGHIEDGRVVWAEVISRPGGIVYFGSLLTLEQVPQPLVSNLVDWLTR